MGGRVAGFVTFGDAWEGGPGTVYGGFIAAVFDGMLGRAVLSAGHVGVTRSLTIRYVRPTPLHKSLKIESMAGPRAGRHVRSRAACGTPTTSPAKPKRIFRVRRAGPVSGLTT